MIDIYNIHPQSKFQVDRMKERQDMDFFRKTHFFRLWAIGATDGAEIFRKLIFFYEKTVYQI